MKKDLLLKNNEQGNVLIISLMILVILTLIGISVTRTSNTDMLIARNEIPFKSEFYVAEGGLNREVSEVGQGNYIPADLDTPGLVTDQSIESPPHNVGGTAYAYNFNVNYKGFFLPPAGYSTTDFSRYDYEIDTNFGNAQVAGRYFTVGPKAN